jgi:hypothetical protein
MKQIAKVACWLGLLMIFCALCACAQNTIQVVTAFPGPQKSIPSVCKAQADLLWLTIQQYPHPENWRWILLCDDAAWRHLLTHVDHPVDSTYALTSLDAQTSCFRGTTLLSPDHPDTQPDHVVAHELAHIFLHTQDEDRTEQLAQRWLRSCRLVSGEGARCRPSTPGPGVPSW